MEELDIGNNINDRVSTWIEEGYPSVNVITLKAMI